MFLGKLIQQAVELYQREIMFGRYFFYFVKRDLGQSATTQCGEFVSRVVHQNLSHRSGEDHKKMRAALPLLGIISLNFYICFVDEVRGPQSVTWLLAFHIALRHITQIVVDDIKQLVFGGFITTEPFVEEISDISPYHVNISRRGPE